MRDKNKCAAATEKRKNKHSEYNERQDDLITEE